MHTWARVVDLVKPKSLRGGLVARAASDLPFLLEPGMECAFVPPQTDMPRRGIVESITPLTHDVYLIEFDTIDSIDRAEALAGCSCLVRRSDLPVDFDRVSVHPLIGYAVADQSHGNLGTVCDVVENKAQSLLVVASGDQEILIPLVDALVVKIDDEEAVVTTAIPDGLLECSYQSDTL